MTIYTLKDFEQDLAALLRKAENAGISVEDFCGCAEYIIQTGWAEIEARRIVKNNNG